MVSYAHMGVNTYEFSPMWVKMPLMDKVFNKLKIDRE